ncbi:hypothetical protein LAZ67_4001809 [Cordylochernes scorpioides]|uniref:Uncharacterized protein n=1 Tax=Cordylochernes scorpioides TaxID=51811 RepID=A0ABY6KDI4_9ARAC|nr:hypothetical protein LAZ67_4001809 [Cordylochernes scorpioides]
MAFPGSWSRAGSHDEDSTWQEHDEDPKDRDIRSLQVPRAPASSPEDSRCRRLPGVSGHSSTGSSTIIARRGKYIAIKQRLIEGSGYPHKRSTRRRESERQKSKIKDSQAKGIITCAMTDSQVSLILTCKTSKQIWASLTKIYEGDIKKKSIEARNNVSRLRMYPEESWKDYLHRSEKLLENARIMGATIDDEEFIYSKKLKGKRFDSDEDVQKVVQDFFHTLPKSAYEEGIYKLPERWRR